MLFKPIIGNMSNPSINRWGFNQFWHRLWYVDKNFNQKLHQDKIFSELVYFYLNYGTYSEYETFINERWDKEIYNELKENSESIFFKYFRIISFKSPFTDEPIVYRLRIKNKNVYSTKIWIFKFQNWLVINFYAFQTMIGSNKKKPKNNEIRKRLDFLSYQNTHSNAAIKRFKLSISYLFFKKKLNTLNYYYKF